MPVGLTRSESESMMLNNIARMVYIQILMLEWKQKVSKDCNKLVRIIWDGNKVDEGTLLTFGFMPNLKYLSMVHCDIPTSYIHVTEFVNSTVLCLSYNRQS